MNRLHNHRNLPLLGRIRDILVVNDAVDGCHLAADMGIEIFHKGHAVGLCGNCLLGAAKVQQHLPAQQVSCQAGSRNHDAAQQTEERKGKLAARFPGSGGFRNLPPGRLGRVVLFVLGEFRLVCHGISFLLKRRR